MLPRGDDPVIKLKTVVLPRRWDHNPQVRVAQWRIEMRQRKVPRGGGEFLIQGVASPASLFFCRQSFLSQNRAAA